MSNAKLILRPPPNAPFVQGFPGIPGSGTRSAAYISGRVEVRLGSKGLKASWLRIELRKLESIPGGEHWGELIGRGPIDVWQARNGGGAGAAGRTTSPPTTATGEKTHRRFGSRLTGGNQSAHPLDANEGDEEGWELLQDAEFPFRVAIPEGLPPSAKVDKACEIAYELVASLCVKTKRGLLRKESVSSIIQSTHPIQLHKHELHSLWPMYNCADDHETVEDDIKMKVFRQQTCYGPGDTVNVRIVVLSNNPQPQKLKAISFSIKETITFKGGRLASNPNNNRSASQRAETLTGKGRTLGKRIYKGDSQMFDLTASIPKNHTLMSISTAKHIEVSYTMRACLELQGKGQIVLDHLPMTISPFTRDESKATLEQIGFVAGLSDADTLSTYGPGSSTMLTSSPASGSYLGDSRNTLSTAPTSAEEFGRSPVAAGPGAYMSATLPPGTRLPPQGGLASSPTVSGSASKKERQGSLGRRQGPLARTMSMLSSVTGLSSSSSVSGPGLAGRGVPAQIHEWGPYGTARPFVVQNADGTATPVGVFDSPNASPAFPAMLTSSPDSNLLADERRALFHHTDRPYSAEMLGVDPDELGKTGGMNLNRPLNQSAGASSTATARPELAVNTASSSPGTGARIFQRLRRRSSAGGSEGAHAQQQAIASAGPSGSGPYPPRAGAGMVAAANGRSSVDGHGRSSYQQQRRTASSDNVRLSRDSAGASASPSPQQPYSASPSDAAARSAEQEKTALYERARLIAERNQQKASELRGSGNATYSPHAGASAPHSEAGHANATDALPAAIGPMSAEQEKVSLWQRARKQAEKYQKGAQFPKAQTGRSDGSEAEAAPRPIAATAGTPADAPAAAATASPVALPSGSGSPFAAASPVVAAPTSAAASSSAHGGWMTAAEEKERLYQKARQEAQQYQSSYAAGATFPDQDPSLNAAASSSTHNGAAVAGTSGAAAVPGAARQAEWSDSTNEKERLFRHAQAQAQTYQMAYEAALSGQPPPGAPAATAGTSTAGFPAFPAPTSAADEKEQIRRFLEAREAVAQHQAGTNLQRSWTQKYSNYESAPVPEYANTIRDEDLDNGALEPGSTPPVPALPPTTSTSASGALALANPGLSEKEKLKMHYAALDAAAGVGSSSSTATVTPQPAPALGSSAVSEQQRMQPQQTLTTPQASSSAMLPAPTASQSGVPLPVSGSHMSAQSEKEQLRLYYAAKDASESGASGSASGSAFSAVPPPTTKRPLPPIAAPVPMQAVPAQGVLRSEHEAIEETRDPNQPLPRLGELHLDSDSDSGTVVHLPPGVHEGKQRARSPDVPPTLDLPSLDMGAFVFDWVDKGDGTSRGPTPGRPTPSPGKRNEATTPQPPLPQQNAARISRAPPDAPEAVDAGRGSVIGTGGSLSPSDPSGRPMSVTDANGGTFNVILRANNRGSYAPRQASIYDPKIASHPWGLADEDDADHDARARTAATAAAPPPLPPKIARA